MEAAGIEPASLDFVKRRRCATFVVKSGKGNELRVNSLPFPVPMSPHQSSSVLERSWKTAGQVSRRQRPCKLLHRGNLNALNLLTSAWFQHHDRRVPEPAQERGRSGYAPRRPETTILYRVVQHHLGTWLGNARNHERIVPWISGSRAASKVLATELPAASWVC